MLLKFEVIRTKLQKVAGKDLQNVVQNTLKVDQLAQLSPCDINEDFATNILVKSMNNF